MKCFLNKLGSVLVIVIFLIPIISLSAIHNTHVALADSTQSIGWLVQFGTIEGDNAYNVAVDEAGNLYVVGRTDGDLGGPSSGSSDAFVRKYDSSGNELWTRQFGTSFYDSADEVAVDKAGNAYVVGSIGRDRSDPSSGDAFIRKYDSLGNELWTRQFGTSFYDTASGVGVDKAGNAYVVGSIGRDRSDPSLGDAYVRKYDSSGNELWIRQFGTSFYDSALGVAVDEAGNLYVVGRTDGDLGGPSSGSSDAFVRKYDSSGNELWTRQFGTSERDRAYNVAVGKSGKAYVVGGTYGDLDGTSSGGGDAFVRKYDSSGNELWTRQFGTSGLDYARGVVVGHNNDAYVSGLTYGSLPGEISAGGADAFIAKFTHKAGTTPPIAAKPLTTLTFDEIPFQPVDGLNYNGVTFGFQIDGVPSTDASYNAGGPGQIMYIQTPCLEGDAAGTLTLTFNQPTTVVEFGVAFSTSSSLPVGATVELYRPGVGWLRQSIDLATSPDVTFTEALFSYSGPAVTTVVITFNSDTAYRFAVDNLKFHQGEYAAPHS